MKDEDLQIEFCSLDHFLELQNNMSVRLQAARDLYPDWFIEPSSPALPARPILSKEMNPNSPLKHF